jgi:type VI secretion system secreted protein Hcp
MAYEFYVTIEGSKSGIIKGDVVKRGHEGKIAGLAFDYEVLVEQVARRGSGQAAGKRQHSPITITKRWDVATPRLFQALVTGEILKSVLVEFEGTDRKTGRKVIYHTVKLTNASLTDIFQYADVDTGELEDVSIVFQKIEIENKIGKTVAMDDVTK